MHGGKWCGRGAVVEPTLYLSPSPRDRERPWRPTERHLKPTETPQIERCLVDCLNDSVIKKEVPKTGKGPKDQKSPQRPKELQEIKEARETYSGPRNQKSAQRPKEPPETKRGLRDRNTGRGR